MYKVGVSPLKTEKATSAKCVSLSPTSPEACHIRQKFRREMAEATKERHRVVPPGVFFHIIRGVLQ